MRGAPRRICSRSSKSMRKWTEPDVSAVERVAEERRTKVLSKLTDGGKALVFYAVTLALMLAVALMPGASTEVAMLTPLVAVLVMLFVVTRDGYTRDGLKSLGLHHLGLRAWPVAILGPLLVLGVAYGAVWGTGLADFTVPDGLVDQSASLGVPLWAWMPVAMIIGPMFTLGLVLSFGE